MFSARLRLILARAARPDPNPVTITLNPDPNPKMSLRRAQNVFMPKNINSITINITLEGIEKIKTEKNDNKTL